MIFFSAGSSHTSFDCDWSSDVCSSDLTSAISSRLSNSKLAFSLTPRLRDARENANLLLLSRDEIALVDVQCSPVGRFCVCSRFSRAQRRGASPIGSRDLIV